MGLSVPLAQKLALGLRLGVTLVLPLRVGLGRREPSGWCPLIMRPNF